MGLAPVSPPFPPLLSSCSGPAFTQTRVGASPPLLTPLPPPRGRDRGEPRRGTGEFGGRPQKWREGLRDGGGGTCCQRVAKATRGRSQWEGAAAVDARCYGATWWARRDAAAPETARGGDPDTPRPSPGNRAETPGDHPPAHAEASPPNPGASPVCELKFHRGWFASARCKSGE